MRRLQREQQPKSPFVFTSERVGPFTTAGFARMMERAGIEAGLPFKLRLASPSRSTRTCFVTPELLGRGPEARGLGAAGPLSAMDQESGHE